jgi:hypothetical protein
VGWGRVVVFYFRVLVNVCVCISSVRVLGGWGTVVAFCFCVLGNVYSHLMLRLCVDAIFVSNVASPARTLPLTLSLTRAHTRTRRLPCLSACAAAAAAEQAVCSPHSSVRGPQRRSGAPPGA